VIDKKYGKVTLENRPNADPDEPCFVFRAQDILAPPALYAYADLIEATIPGERARNMAIHIREQARAMANWPNRKLPDGLR